MVGSPFVLMVEVEGEYRLQSWLDLWALSLTDSVFAEAALELGLAIGPAMTVASAIWKQD